MSAPVQVGPSPEGGGLVPSLTELEMDVLRGVAHGKTYMRLAAHLGLSYKGAKHAGGRIIRKLGANDMAHAVFLACRAGLLDGRPQRHGDHAGFAAHRYRKEEPCEACWAGERAYRTERRKARKAARTTRSSPETRTS